MKIKTMRLALITIIMLIGSINFTNCENVESNTAVEPQPTNNETSSEFGSAPGFVLESINGEKISLKDYKGKVVMLNFWATWCPPCRKELPDIIKLWTELNDKGFEVIGIVTERQNKGVLSTIKKMQETYGIKYPLVWYDNKILSDYGKISSIPRTFILNKNGEIIADFEGARPYSVFKKVIMPLL